ncbi:MAG: GNAT family N-acetyltransferase [Eubacteriaceae bacterium]|jgi:hypothetical protein
MSKKKLRFYGLDQSDEWDEIVRSYKDHDVYWLSGYVRAFKLHGDGEPMLVSYDDGSLRGIQVVMRRDIADDPRFTGQIESGQYFDHITPYGYGGWIFEGEGDLTAVDRAYSAWCSFNHTVSEYVRFHPILNNQEQTGDMYEQIALGDTIAMDLSSPETISENMSSKNRNRIRKAMKSGVEIYCGRSPQLFQSFKRIYDNTMDRDHAMDYYYFNDDFYDSILNDLPDNELVFYAVKDGTVIAMAIALLCNGMINYHLAASLREYQILAPNNLLLYRTAVWGSRNGFKTLHLGGGLGFQDDDLLRYKKGFYKGSPRRFYSGRKIFLPEAYEFLTGKRQKAENNLYFPRYRA